MIRRVAVQDIELANAYAGTSRLKLLKIGTVMVRNTQRIRFLLSSDYRYRCLFFLVAARLAPRSSHWILKNDHVELSAMDSYVCWVLNYVVRRHT